MGIKLIKRKHTARNLLEINLTYLSLFKKDVTIPIKFKQTFAKKPVCVSFNLTDGEHRIYIKDVTTHSATINITGLNKILNKFFIQFFDDSGEY
jgi:hypothetical protein